MKNIAFLMVSLVSVCTAACGSHPSAKPSAAAESETPPLAPAVPLWGQTHLGAKGQSPFWTLVGGKDTLLLLAFAHPSFAAQQSPFPPLQIHLRDPSGKPLWGADCLLKRDPFPQGAFPAESPVGALLQGDAKGLCALKIPSSALPAGDITLEAVAPQGVHFPNQTSQITLDTLKVAQPVALKLHFVPYAINGGVPTAPDAALLRSAVSRWLPVSEVVVQMEEAQAVTVTREGRLGPPSSWDAFEAGEAPVEILHDVQEWSVQHAAEPDEIFVGFVGVGSHEAMGIARYKMPRRVVVLGDSDFRKDFSTLIHEISHHRGVPHVGTYGGRPMTPQGYPYPADHPGGLWALNWTSGSEGPGFQLTPPSAFTELMGTTEKAGASDWFVWKWLTSGWTPEGF